MPGIGSITNEIQGGDLRIQANNIRLKLGGFMEGTASLGLVNETVTFDGDSTLNVPKLEPVQLAFRRNEEGKLSGSVDAAVQIANFNGSISVAYENGVVDARGTVGYSTEKMSGEVTLLITDARTARSVTQQQLSPEQINQSAQQAAGGSNGEASTGPRALAGYGTLTFNLSEWLAGSANVAINNLGQVTIIGAITPPAEVELFPQRDFVKEIFKIEVRTLYGVPLVGNVFLFANIGMDALAKLGPAKIYNIRIDGTFSTDPEVLNSFSLQGTLNISAFAGLRLRAEGGAGVELLGHDIKAGVGVNALAGIRGYVEATPTIGYREVAHPEAGRKGEFFIKGHMEIAAQPFLGLGGDLFVELDSPWWSPAPDKKWIWPLGELEYPLPGEFGIGADIKGSDGREGYVLGSSEVPEIEFGEVDFNKDKFMTDLINDHVPPKQSSDEDRQGEFQDGNTSGEGQSDPTLTDSQGNPTDNQPGTGQQDGDEIQQPSEEVQRNFSAGLSALGRIAEQSEREPLDRNAITAALNRIKNQYGFTTLIPQVVGDEWHIQAAMPGISNRQRPLIIKGVISPEDDGENEELSNADPQIAGQVAEALSTIPNKERGKLEVGKLSRESAEQVARQIRSEYSIFRIFEVIDGGDSWDYHYVANPDEIHGDNEDRPEKAEGNRENIESPITQNQLRALAESLQVRTYIDENGSERERNRAGGHLWFTTSDGKSFGYTQGFYSGRRGAQRFWNGVFSALREQGIFIRLGLPSGGVGGLNLHTEEALRILASGIVSRSSKIVKIDAKVYTYFPPCDHCENIPGSPAGMTALGGGSFQIFHSQD